MKAVETPAQDNKVVSGKEWLDARNPHPAEEDEFTRLRDELSRQRIDLPRLKGEKNDVFQFPKEKDSLADLFDGLSELIVHQFMFGSEAQEGCLTGSSCPIILMAPLFI